MNVTAGKRVDIGVFRFGSLYCWMSDFEYLWPISLNWSYQSGSSHLSHLWVIFWITADWYFSVIAAVHQNLKMTMMLSSASQLQKHLCDTSLNKLYTYLEIWRRSGWWYVWVEHWQPVDQTPCCCVRLPDTAPPSSWNSRLGLWFGKSADPHLARNQQRQDTSVWMSRAADV